MSQNCPTQFGDCSGHQNLASNCTSHFNASWCNVHTYTSNIASVAGQGGCPVNTNINWRNNILYQLNDKILAQNINELNIELNKELARRGQIQISNNVSIGQLDYASHLNNIRTKLVQLKSISCPCNCNYSCSCDGYNYCSCNCNYCTCNCNYCTCNCNYSVGGGGGSSCSCDLECGGHITCPDFGCWGECIVD